jgi:DNA-binding response OmpR family regulator
MTTLAPAWAHLKGTSVRLRIALVRAFVDELERSLNEPQQARRVARQLAEALEDLARALRTRAGDEDGTASTAPAPSAPIDPMAVDAVIPLFATLPAGRILRFGQFRLDVAEERIWKNGQELTLRRKPFSILRFLARNPQRVVSKAEIVEAVWGGMPALSESLLRTHIRELRQVVGEGLVETVIRRGYRFVAAVEGLDLCDGENVA